jgi:hypothetical protein
MIPLQKAAWNKAIRDSVDALLHKGGYNEESSARHQLAMMNFDVESEQAQAVEPIGYVRHADKTFWPHPECAVYASVSPSLAPVYAHPAPPLAGERAELIADLRLNHEYCPKEVILEAADMLEADVSLINEGNKAQQVAVPAGSDMTPERAAFFMRRFKKEEKLLGPNEQKAIDYVLAMLEADAQELEATERQVEILSDDLSKCSKAQQVAVPMTEAQIFACDPVPHVMFDQQRIDFARAIEAFHGIGAKP